MPSSTNFNPRPRHGLHLAGKPRDGEELLRETLATFDGSRESAGETCVRVMQLIEAQVLDNSRPGLILSAWLAFSLLAAGRDAEGGGRALVSSSQLLGLLLKRIDPRLDGLIPDVRDLRLPTRRGRVGGR